MKIFFYIDILAQVLSTLIGIGLFLFIGINMLTDKIKNFKNGKSTTTTKHSS